VKSLLTDDPNTRLDIEQIKNHSFFKNLNWGNMQDRIERPPFVPDDWSQFKNTIFEN